ncbi:MAG: hypothetical protein OHK0057_13480 [Thermoflexibacter sp.]|uniref:Sensory transduction regulator n=1 Tax=Thermoflexibacter ruber TaxID=1003 RepID=A0A1I2DUP5_9BACT|nr:hypothetical protein [Thermoflexibacter ruber]SFE84148.1 hypothetical protein SAMN04488541_100813 [Thermoflexibacter ruber]
MEHNVKRKEYFVKLAERLDGTYIEYTDEICIISLRLPDGRSQSVRGFFKQRGQDLMLMLMSKVCFLDEYPNVDFRALIEENNHLHFSKFVIHHDYLEVLADVHFSDVTIEFLEHVALEVAQTADDWEYKITGQDIH